VRSAAAPTTPFADLPDASWDTPGDMNMPIGCMPLFFCPVSTVGCWAFVPASRLRSPAGRGPDVALLCSTADISFN
jgi:hypothetical protein